MRTVKELSERTGISVRTLHYYDEIGLLPPTEKSEAGYRLYDDKALETLQRILFFREFDIPLKEIKAVIEHPALDRNRILHMQKKMLMAKKARVERLIASIDDILKGENTMDFAMFNKAEVEEWFQTMFDGMLDEVRQTVIDKFGSVEEWRKHYMEAASSEDVQKRYAKVVEWYGGKDAVKQVTESVQKRENAIRQKLLQKRGCDPHSFEVKAIIGEYGFAMKELCQIKEEEAFMLALAQSYRNEQYKQALDERYGDGAAAFFAEAIEAFYQK